MTNKTIEETYKKMSQKEHILNRGSMYLGTLDFIKEKQFIYINKHIEQLEISYSPALYKIIDELIVNSYDATIKDNNVTMIKAEISQTNFSIFNNGIGIDIVKHKEYNIYVPQLIFGELLTSTHYDESEERITGGVFGLGSKLSNIYSDKFIIEIWDIKRKLYYKQIFEKNLSKINKPIIETQINQIKGGVRITIYPSFHKFETDKFSDDMINLLSRRIIDLVGLVKKDISIYLNNIKFESGFDKYLALIKKTDNKWINGNCVKNALWNFGIRFNTTIESNNHISFVNGINTNKNGKHITYLIDLLFEKIQKMVSPELTKKILNDYLNIVLKTSIINPSFNSQSKEELMTPFTKFGFECNISDSFWKEVKNSDIIYNLKIIVNLSIQKQLSKFEGTKKNKIKGIPKLEDANLAGTKKSVNCTLILTEGDSAKATAISGISAINNGRDFYGVYPLRGKLLNVREASISQINSNQEIIDIKKILGLKNGIVYNHSNINELRYNSILLMMDADEDGTHIKGLIINFFNYFYKSLLQIDGFLKVLVTPVVKVFLINNTLSFSNLRTYKNWVNDHKELSYKIKYYKGLGTSSALEAKEYFKCIDKNVIDIIDNNCNNDIILAFAKNKANERKNWLFNYNSTNILNIEPPTKITIKDFIHRELIHFSNYDNIRSIPLLADGFKPSQRKVLYACFTKNLKNEIKVAQFASYVAESTSYHHGEQSLIGTIINMSQNFIGSNNLNLLVPIGQFGTRLLGGKDHASGRYIFTYLNDIVNKIFIKDDIDLLEFNDDDGQKIEPKFFIPIIPVILINGSEGIGTGFSTFIPNYNLKDVVTWFKNKLNNIKNNELTPKYNNFKGKIFKFDDTTYISSGICHIKKDKIIITELPLKLWTSNYKEILEDMIINNLIKSYINYSSDIEVHFEIKVNNIEYFINLENMVDLDNLNCLLKKLKLYKTIKLSNMTLYNEHIKIKTYTSSLEICEEFYKFRLPYYDKRKLLLIENIKKELIICYNQINFINLVKINNSIFNLEEKELIKLLDKNKFIKYNDNYNYLINMSFKQLSISNSANISNKIKLLESNKIDIENKTSKDLWLNDLNKIE